MTPMMSTITRGRKPQPPAIVTYGTGGIGKSTFASHAPSPAFVDIENGLAQIDTAKFPVAKALEDVLAQLKAVRDEPHEFKTLVVDSLDWLERLIWDDLCRQYGVKSIEKVDGGYGKGYTLALAAWREFLSILDAIREKRLMAIVLLAHDKVEKFEDPEAGAFDRYSPRLHKNATALVTEWADAVLFATRRMRVDKDTGRAKAVGEPGGDRIMRCIGGPACIAKNRYGLPETLPLSWDAFMDAYRKGTEAHA